jgi:hypothetical protein
MNDLPNYDFWQDALDGKTVEYNQNAPQPGFYRTKNGAPVAIWHDGADILIMVNDLLIQPESFEDIWTRCCTRPVTEEQYNDARANGGVWHDMDAAVADTLGDNIRNATDPSAIGALIEVLESAAASYSNIDSDETASKAQSLRSRALELKAKADKIREHEKKPHLEASRAVDATWMPLVKAADAVVAKLRQAMERFETVKLAARRKAEAEERARIAAEAPKPIDMSGPDQPEPEIAPKPGIRGGYGRAASVGTKKVVTGVDTVTVATFFRNDPSLVALLTKLAQAAIERGHDVPGIQIEEMAVVR